MPRSGARKPIAATNGPRSHKGEQTRALILKAAKRVFERDGYHDSRIVDIANWAKLSHGSIYHYFESKEQIFREVAEEQERRLTAPGATQDDRSHGLTPAESIVRANRHYLERYRAEAQIMRVIEQASRYDPFVNAGRMTSQRHFAERSERAIRRWQREGQVDRRVNPTIAADALGAMVARFAELWMTQSYREYDFEEAVDQLSLLWANALGMSSTTPNEEGKTARAQRSR